MVEEVSEAARRENKGFSVAAETRRRRGRYRWEEGEFGTGLKEEGGGLSPQTKTS